MKQKCNSRGVIGYLCLREALDGIVKSSPLAYVLSNSLKMVSVGEECV